MAAEDIATTAELLALVEGASSIGPRATGTVTIASHPVSATETITHGSLVLTSVAGARTSGANNFSGDAGSTDAVAANFAAAVNDASNAWAGGGITATVAGSVVTLTGNRGDDGNVTLVCSDASMTVTGMTGGDAWLTHALEYAALLLDANCWGCFRNKASIYLAAHFLTQLPDGLTSGASPQVSSVTIGAISKSFAVASPTDSRFGSTKWGKLYLELAEVVMCAPGGVAGAGGNPLGVVL